MSVLRFSAVCFMLTVPSSCTEGPNTVVVALATRLAADGPVSLRKTYVTCGTKALSQLPSERIALANQAPDSAGIWAVLGSDALDHYITTCRTAERVALGVLKP